MAFGFFYGAAFAIDESDDGAHGMPVDDDAREFDRTVLCAPETGVVSGGRAAEAPVIRTPRMGEARK